MSGLDELQAQARATLYAVVRNADPELYHRALEIGHIPIFIEDREQAALEVEVACMELIAKALML